MLMFHDYVHIFAFDFSKAFDTVRHYTLTNKMVTLDLAYLTIFTIGSMISK